MLVNRSDGFVGEALQVELETVGRLVPTGASDAQGLSNGQLRSTVERLYVLHGGQSASSAHTLGIGCPIVLVPFAALAREGLHMVDAGPSSSALDTVAIVNVTANLLPRDRALFKAWLAGAAVVLQAVDTRSTSTASVANAIVDVLAELRSGE